MITLEQQAAAKERMEKAFAAIVAYADSAVEDNDLHCRLAEELRKATAEFLVTLKQGQQEGGHL